MMSRTTPLSRRPRWSRNTPSTIPTLCPRPTLCLLAVAPVLVGLFAASSAHAQVVCGDTLGPGGNFVLTQDLAACDGGTPALTVVGPVTVDLAGYQIKCAAVNPAQGVLVQGRSVRISNGSIRACLDYGLSVAGEGRHRITNVTLRSNTGPGMVVTSEKNSIVSDASIANTSTGFLIQSDGNKITGNDATNNDDEGFLFASDGNKISDNRAVNNTNEGFDIAGDANKVSGNIATTNGNEGFEISGTGNKLSENSAQRNSQDGFYVTGPATSLDRNSATHNSNHGYEILTDGIKMVRNSAVSNGVDGIDISGNDGTFTSNRTVNNTNGVDIVLGVGNRISRTVALENSNKDLRDPTACADNTWSRNVFRTDNDACVE